jgi:hypothetical protein
LKVERFSEFGPVAGYHLIVQFFLEAPADKNIRNDLSVCLALANHGCA